MEYFLQRILNRTEHMCTALDGLRALEVAFGAKRSAEVHEKVVFGEPEEGIRP